MNRHLQAAIIGGGVVGCAVLRALARRGWRDVALFERTELTAGATWHSSGIISHFTRIPFLTRLASITRATFRDLEAEAEQPIGLIEAGSIRLAITPGDYRELAAFAETNAGLACGSRMVTEAEVAERWPLARFDRIEKIEGALLVEADCRLNAADYTQALARTARAQGAAIHRGVEVTGLSPRPGGGWVLTTNQGNWTAEHVVAATGIFSRRSLPKLGISIPSAVLAHQYLVTESHPSVIAHHESGAGPLPVLRKPDIGLSIRQEGLGFSLSLYEENISAVFPHGPPPGFGMQLFNSDMESIESCFEGAIALVPALGEVGIRSIINGPMPWSPDFVPIVGPLAGRRGLWVAEATSYGVTWSGGIAQLLADWIVDGDPGQDVSLIDPRRFGDYADAAWADSRAIADFKGTYGSANANAAPEVSPIHNMLESRGAVFEEIDGRAVATSFTKAGRDFDIGIAPLRPPTIVKLSASRPIEALLQALQAPTLPASGFETHSQLLSSRGTILGLVRIRLNAETDNLELAVEAPCPRAAAEDLLARLATISGVSACHSDTPQEAMIVLAQDPELLSLTLGLPADTALGRIVPLHVAGIAGGHATRLTNLGGWIRWELFHATDIHHHVFSHVLSVLPQAKLVGTTDYAEMRAVMGEPMIGRDIDANITPDGRRISGLTSVDPISTILTRAMVAAPADGPLLAGTVIYDSGGNIVGSIMSATTVADGFACFAAVAPDLVNTDKLLTLRHGGHPCPVVLQALRYPRSDASSTRPDRS
jgi:glycine/D-amino acid oxidase-like deaminating enzyme